MDKELKAKWVAALRSGKYKQGQGRLRSVDDTFCCLGVLADVEGKTWELIQQVYVVDGERWAVYGSYHLPTDAVGRLAHMNDEGSTFEELADYIEENL